MFPPGLGLGGPWALGGVQLGLEPGLYIKKPPKLQTQALRTEMQPSPGCLAYMLLTLRGCVTMRS